jgi:RNA polymerase sigma-70 factor, ECF subfamily
MGSIMSRNDQDERYAGLATLMDSYLDGDQRAFAALYQRLGPTVRAQIRSKISNPATAEDLLQATFMKAHGARERFAAPDGASPDRAVAVWYSTIARNATIDHLRKLYRERAVKLDTAGDDTTELLDSLRDPKPSIEAIAVEQERELGIAGRIRQALAGLPQTQREVVTLHKIEGKSMAEISAQLGVREGTLRVRAHRGYKALAGLLDAYRTQAAAA